MALSKLSQRLYYYACLMRFNRPWPILLLLWPTLWALWIAGQGHPSIKNIIIFVAGVLVMRTAGCVVNDMADRHLDGLVARTQARMLASGKVSLREAFCILLILLVVAFILVLQLNTLTILLSFPALALAIIYPFMKRYTYFPQVVLGMAWYMSIPMAFAAELNTVPWLAWYLYGIAILWAVIYDTYYAMVDRADDIKAGIKSTAILFASWDRAIIGILQALVILLLIGLGLILDCNGFYYLCLMVAAGYFIYEQWITRTGTTISCMQAFLNNNQFGWWIWVAVLLGHR